ncbi:hypothetical protein NMD21_11460 [Citrobacter portucalensis]|uniref:hypothetical protein n=1 Tax=Citrobacter portucalensis TaxID=1639133 RepID=UPI0015E95EA1|nr:hypothetical protein HVZ40_10990 [Citrobacter freundii]QMD57603.1 hypothetical protein HVZ38_10985 [Citrobacter freundii]
MSVALQRPDKSSTQIAQCMLGKIVHMSASNMRIHVAKPEAENQTEVGGPQRTARSADRRQTAAKKRRQ